MTTEKETEIEALTKEFKLIKKKEFVFIFDTLEQQGIDWQKIDFHSMGFDVNYDMMLCYLFQEYGIIIETATTPATNQATTNNNIGKDDMYFWAEVVNQTNSTVIIGDKGSGKTAIAHRILGYIRKHTKRDIYCFNHPMPHLLKPLGWKNMYSIEELNRLKDVCLYIDEPQQYWKVIGGRSNEALAKILTLARQRNIYLIISTSMTQYVTRMLEGQIDTWVIKDCDPDTIKQGGRAIKIIKDYCTLDVDGFRLKTDEYLFYSRKFYDRFKGRFTFQLPAYWNDRYSKPYGDVK